MIEIAPGYVLIIPRDADDQHALTEALYAAADPELGEGVGTTTATRVLSFIVPQSLADRIGRGASSAPPLAEQPDAPGADGPGGGDAPPDADGAADGADGGDAQGDADGAAPSAGRTSRAPRARKATDPAAADPAAADPTQEG